MNYHLKIRSFARFARLLLAFGTWQLKQSTRKLEDVILSKADAEIEGF